MVILPRKNSLGAKFKGSSFFYVLSASSVVMLTSILFDNWSGLEGVKFQTFSTWLSAAKGSPSRCARLTSNS